jgi:glycerol-3-phosphate acyltransferase PlsY
MSGELVTEVKRKVFHLFSLLYAALYAYGGRERALWVLGAAFLLTAAVEAARLHRPAFNARLMALFGDIHREKEADRPSGILWTLGGAFLTIWLVPDRDVVITSLWFLAVGDAAAALVGRTWGHIRLGAKSLEGSAACFLACWTAGMVFLDSPGGRAPEAAVGAFTAALMEALPMPLDDNLWIPTVSGLVLTLLRMR